MNKALFMETTKISPDRTVEQIQSVLRQHGATAILVEYKSGIVSALSFKKMVNGSEIPFSLPCRWQAVYKLLCDRAGANAPRHNWEGTDRQWKALRISWRQILRWVEAQMALVETNMVSIEEVFLPYIQTTTGKTLYESIGDRMPNLLEFK